MDKKKQIVEWIKEVKFAPFPDGGGLDVSVKHQLPDHAIEAIADHLLACGVTVVVKCNDCQHLIRTKDACLCGHPANFINKTALEVSTNHYCRYGKPKEKQIQRSKRANLIPLVDDSGEMVALVQEDLVTDVLEDKE